MAQMTQGDYAFGRVWADELLANFRDDPYAHRIMERLDLTMDDLRQYYVRQPFYDRVHARFCEHVARAQEDDPVKHVLLAVYKVKREVQR